MLTEAIKFTVNGKKYRLKPWLNILVNGAIFAFMAFAFSLIFLGLFL